MPYLGPGLLELAAAPVPTTPEDLAAWLGRQVALPKRARGNCWAAAQYIETSRHRSTLDKLMATAFAPPVPPTPLHRALAAAAPPMIVDTWYDGAMRAALAGQQGWGEIQGCPHAKIGEMRWYRAWDAAGQECPPEQAAEWRTLLYKPHGGVVPAANFLLADSDYVEVLTEIDIQTPIPEDVRRRRAGGGFLFLGCRFHDQLLRSYARQILKRSGGGHLAVMGGIEMTRNERAFLEEMQIAVIDQDLPAFVTALAAS
ncbi:SIR2 family protein [Rhodovastum atsumiense]|uniref:SIR2 family protein n=2 Tax=Rhodovastum atsumiense TaxID=504468 RepID=A0A5M6IZL7_9PROT|nr:SIR2 family protein [Rhodovastum atsumiense]